MIMIFKWTKNRTRTLISVRSAASHPEEEEATERKKERSSKREKERNNKREREREKGWTRGYAEILFS